MSRFGNPASTALEDAQAYSAALLDLLGDRDALAVLREMPEALRAAIDGLSAVELARPEAPGKWSIGEVVDHLTDSELVGSFRFRMVLTQDRPALPGYDQDAWVRRLHPPAGDARKVAERAPYVAIAAGAALAAAGERLLSRTRRGKSSSSSTAGSSARGAAAKKSTAKKSTAKKARAKKSTGSS